MTQLFDLNARIQQLTWSLIFYEKYSTSLLYLWFWPPLILGGSVISAGTIHNFRRVKVPGTGPLWNPCISMFLLVSNIYKKLHQHVFTSNIYNKLHQHVFTSITGFIHFFCEKIPRLFKDFSGFFLVFPGPTLSKLSTSISEILSNHIIYHVLTFVYKYIRNYPS